MAAPKKNTVSKKNAVPLAERAGAALSRRPRQAFSDADLASVFGTNPDRMIFDLDPDEGLRWSEVVQAALDIRDQLGELGLVPFVKTTGGKGLHVVVPVVRRQTWSAIFRFSEGFAAGLARAEPHRFTASMAKADRRERIFVDFHRNSRGSSAVAAYSLRARPGVAAAAPVAWPELSDIEDPGELNWASVPRWLRDRPDPWRNIDQCARALTKDMARKVGADIQS
jgi:DNA primase